MVQVAPVHAKMRGDGYRNQKTAGRDPIREAVGYQDAAGPVMIARAVAAGLPLGWVTGDEAYGDNGPVRAWLEDEQISYVLAVACDHRVDVGGTKIRADILARRVPKRAWQRRSCGPGSKSKRIYDWALVGTADPDHHLLIRRTISKPGELAYYRRYAPRRRDARHRYPVFRPIPTRRHASTVPTPSRISLQ